MCQLDQIRSVAQSHGMGGSWKGEREEVKEEEERALDRCKEGADDGGEGRVAEEAGGPHQVAQSC